MSCFAVLIKKKLPTTNRKETKNGTQCFHLQATDFLHSTGRLSRSGIRIDITLSLRDSHLQSFAKSFTGCSFSLLSSWPYGNTYFWLLGQVLCEAQRREHSRSYVTGVVTKHDCMDAGAGRSSCREGLNKESEIYDFIWLGIV